MCWGGRGLPAHDQLAAILHAVIVSFADPEAAPNADETLDALAALGALASIRQLGFPTAYSIVILNR